MKTLRNIKGMNELIDALPEEYRHFSCFNNILKFEYKRIFDDEICTDIYNADIIITDSNEKFKIRILLKNVNGEIFFSTFTQISFLVIHDLLNDGYELENRYRIFDIENNGFSLYCEDIEVSLCN